MASLCNLLGSAFFFSNVAYAYCRVSLLRMVGLQRELTIEIVVK